MNKPESSFASRVLAIVAQIPAGRVMTYGQLAALCGSAGSARVVGGIAHFSDPELPWHRVVNKKGGLASGYPGGRAAHKKHLESEDVSITDDLYVQDMETRIWWPDRGIDE